MKFCKLYDQLADVFSKAVTSEKFIKFRKKKKRKKNSGSIEFSN